MKRCPQCKGEYPDATQFCPRDGATLAPDDPMIGKVIGGRYRVISRVGRGGMGSVYRGEHIKMRRTTAIKILNAALAGSPEFVARFEREAELASTLSHPHAVAIYDYGEDEGLVYLAMEFLEGEPLSTVLVKRRILPIDLAVRVARQAAEALDAAHRRGIIHRDFKPDNVMLCEDGTGLPTVKVVDFGIAKQTEAVGGANNLTQTGAVLGTPTYMSPEQVSDKQLDGRSDLYSLALVVYQMLSGTLPFRAETAQAVMVMRLVEPPVPLRSVAPNVPASVEAVVMKALAREPHGRQASVLEFARELEQAATSTMAAPGVPATPPHGFPANYPTPSQPGVSTYPNQTPHTNPATIGDPTIPGGTTPPGSYPTPAPGHFPTPAPGHFPTPVPSTAPVTPLHTPMQMTAAVPQPRRGGGGIVVAIAAVAIALVVVPVALYVAYVAFGSAGTNGNGNVAVANGNSSVPQGTGNTNASQPNVPVEGANAEYLVGLARDQRDREEYDQAEESARDAVKADPKSAVALATLADILLDQSKNSEGAKLAQQAVDLDRKSATAHRVLAASAIADRQFGKGIEEAKKALALDPSADDEGYANVLLGDAYANQNLNDDALEAYNRAKQYTGNRPLIRLLARLGVADSLASKGNADSGIKDLTALASDSSLRPNARALVNRNIAKLLIGKQKPADAVPYCQKALETVTMPNIKASVKIIQGLAYLYQRQFKDALACAEEGIKLAGEAKELQGYGQAVRGVSLVGLGRKDEGVAALNMATKILPDDPNIASIARAASAAG